MAWPSTPRLVMIWMTPLAASVPYKVAAAGPLMISMLSMSLGSMSFNPEIAVVRPTSRRSDCMRIPSM